MALFFLIILWGCEKQPTEVEDYQQQPVLTAFLYNGEPVEPVTLERVGDIRSYYDPADNAIEGAEIKIWAVDDPQQDTLYFQFDPEVKKYLPANGDDWGTPRSFVRYRIEARKPSEDLYLWAETVIPDTFTLTITPAPTGFDSVAYLDTLTRLDDPILLNWTSSTPIGGYVIPITCLDSTYIPLDPDWNPEEDEIPEDSSRFSFDLALPEYTMLSLAWINFRYQGWYDVQVQAVDPEYWEYYFSVFRFWMGQVDELEYNIHGGLGIFAGIARERFRVYIKKVE
jgi:hypothetical protein